MHLYKTQKGNIVIKDSQAYLINEDWDALINRDALYNYLSGVISNANAVPKEQQEDYINNYLLSPIGSQEVWAAGVTYLKSRDARMEESKDSGAADCYERVYEAERPELFFKSLPHRVAGHNQSVNIRKDSKWDVPEPELALYINSNGIIQAYTIGNDMSSRSIEGENPLYLPQAKTYDRSAALGPCLYIMEEEISKETIIQISIQRDHNIMFDESTTLSRMKRSLKELAFFLFREMDFATGAFLMTGTCLVPDSSFTLQKGDVISITIQGIGTLTNTVAVKK